MLQTCAQPPTLNGYASGFTPFVVAVGYVAVGGHMGRLSCGMDDVCVPWTSTDSGCTTRHAVGGGFSRLLNLVDATEDVGWAKLGYVNPARRRCLNTADDLTWKLDRPTFWINWHKSCEHKEEVKHIALGAASFRSNVALVSQFYLEMTWKKTTRPVPPWPCGWPRSVLFICHPTQGG